MTIYLVEKALLKEEAIIRDRKFFKDKGVNPGEPDILYMRRAHISKQGGKKVPITMNFVVEIQNEMTPEIVAHKLEQYQMAGIDDVIFVNPNDYERIGELDALVRGYSKWLGARLP